MSEDQDARVGCDYCGRIPQEGPSWLGIEVFRETDPYEGWGEHRNLVFCTQEHAGRYFLERPLPPPVAPTVMQRTWRDRVEMALISVGVFSVFALMALGVWWIVETIRG